MAIANPTVRQWLDEAAADPDAFWGKATERCHWFGPWKTVLEWTPPTFRWFTGGLTNISYNALDLHVERGRGDHRALIALNERGERRVFTYAELLDGVTRVAAALRGAGVGRGDTVGIYMPTMPEAIMAMLACTRIGAVHIVVFAGFGSGALSERLRRAGAKVLLAADITYRRGKEVPLLPIVAEALAEPESPVRRVVVHTRSGGTGLDDPRAQTWDDFLAGGAGESTAHEVMEANDPAFILATSGTTAKPKLAVHSHGAYQVGIHSTGNWVMALRERDVWWSTSDIGWIVGHSFIVYAPLLAGCTTIAFEGALDHPGPETFYRILAEERVTGLFTAPTAVRMLMAHGRQAIGDRDLSSVERVLCAGEVLNIPAWEWFQHEVFGEGVPVIDHMWQTETGGPVFGNPYGISLLPIKPGSAGIALPGFFAEVRTLEGEPAAAGEKGIVVITRPFPGLTATIWNDPERYAADYWGRVPGAYFTGDAAAMDEDGYFTFSGRADEIIKIAGHRIGTIEVETALLRHPAIAEAGVTGRPDELRGEVISAFVVLRAGHEATPELKDELLATVRRELGPVAVISDINVVRALPKTRSGKIMRRVFKAVVLERDPGDISTIEDAGSVEEARAAWQALRDEVTRP
ncbi:MAG: acetate--CoA ligase [Thermomicrobiales bacterium]|nr:acetate--CoA ligase [Thermomicrobiales bacterium]